MKRQAYWIFATLLLMMQIPATASAQISPEENALYNDMVIPISLGDVDQLENLGTDLLASKARMPDGKWKFDAYNTAFDNFVDAGDMRTNQLSELEATFAKWKSAYPNSKFGPVAHAYVLYRNAFAIRGTKFSNEVWKDDWKPFYENLKRAHTLLQNSKKQAQDNPFWYSTMASVKGALGLPKKDVLAVARAGLARDPAHFETAANTLFNLLPVWGGSAKQVHNWIEEVSARAKSTEADALYAYLYWDIMGNLAANRIDIRSIDWKRMKTSTDDLLQRYPTIQNQTKAIDVACLSHDPAEVIRRYEFYAKRVGPAVAQTVDPAVQCKWPIVGRAVRDPDVIDLKSLREPDAPKKTGVN